MIKILELFAQVMQFVLPNYFGLLEKKLARKMQNTDHTLKSFLHMLVLLIFKNVLVYPCLN